MSAEFTEVVQQLISEALQVTPELVTPDLAFGDLPEWDSMGHMEIMLALEERFGVEVNADTISALTSVPLIVQHLEEQANG